MPPSGSKANYKSFEAQARMVRAIVAAHPEVKWNYKEIVACYGSDMTEHALNHRFRRVRAQAVVINEARQHGFDIKNLATDEKHLPATQESVDKDNIAKYFGQSTPDGIQFQFRGIKKDAEKLRQAASNGGDVVNALSLGIGSAPVTPSKPTPVRSRGGSRTMSTKRRADDNFIKRPPSDDEDEETNDSENWSEETPSKRAKTTGPSRGRKAGTPSRLAAIKADATIAAAAQQESVESPPEIETPTPSAPEPAPTMRHTSIFGQVEVDRKPIVSPPEPTIFNNSAFNADVSFNESYGYTFGGSGFPFMGSDDYGADGEC